jgi:hypothetical protein
MINRDVDKKKEAARKSEYEREKIERDEYLDTLGEDSFPASDPPARGISGIGSLVTKNSADEKYAVGKNGKQIVVNRKHPRRSNG